ncbi:MAG: hypothetical protein EAZ40_16990, partial [Rhodobacterales bacterium]
MLQRDPPPAEPAAVADAAPAATLEPDLTTAAAAADDDTLPGLEEALNGDLPALATTAPELAPAPAAPADMAEKAVEDQSFAEVFAKTPADDPKAADAADDLEESLSAALADVADTGIAAPVARPASAPAAAPDAPASSDLPEADEAPFAHVTDTTAFPDGDADLAPLSRVAAKAGDASAGAGASLVDADDIPPAPPSAAMVAFASRRAAAGTGSAPPVDGAQRAATPPPAPALAKFGGPAASQPRTAPAKGFAGLVTAPSIPGTRAKPKGKLPLSEPARGTGQTASGVRSPARPGGTFGTSAPPRNRTGVVFMVLVALLLLCLALIAAWSSFYLTRNATESATETQLAETSAAGGEATATPGVEDEMLADLQDPEGLTDPLPEAEGVPLAAGDAGALATESLDLTQLDADAAPINLAPEEATDLPQGTLAGATPEAVADEAAPEVAAPEAVAADDAAAADPVLPVEPAPGTAVTTDLAVAAPPVEDQDEIFLSAMDAPPPALDALALPVPVLVTDAAPDAPMPPPAFGTVYQFDARGLLVPTPEGILSPDGVMLIAGPPPLVPPARSEVAAAAARALEAAPAAAALPAPGSTAADASLVTAGEAPAAPVVDPTAAPTLADPAMAGFRPRARPEGLAPVAAPEDDASLAVEADTAVATLRPLPRPDSVLAAASASRPAEGVAGLATGDLGAQGASLAAQAEARLAAAAALEAENPSIVAISMRPAPRPSDLSNAVEAAVAAAVRAPEPEAEVIETAAAPPADLKPEELDELNEPEVAVAAPSIPSKASVAKQATFANAINLSRINLIGTYGTDSRRYALVRQSNGRYKKVKVGDKIDGGTIKAITETEVRYQKGGKLISLA